MGTCAMVCMEACGSAQVSKLKVYYLRLDGRRIHYGRGTLPTSLRPLD